MKVQYILFPIKTKWRRQNLTIGQKIRSKFQVKMILTIENCSTEMKDVVSIYFHVAFAVSLPLTLALSHSDGLL